MKEGGKESEESGDSRRSHRVVLRLPACHGPSTAPPALQKMRAKKNGLLRSLRGSPQDKRDDRLMLVLEKARGCRSAGNDRLELDEEIEDDESGAEDHEERGPDEAAAGDPGEGAH